MEVQTTESNGIQVDGKTGDPQLPLSPAKLSIGIGTLLGFLSLPLFWLGYAEGHHPLLGLVLAFLFGGILVFWISWSALSRELRREMLEGLGLLTLFHAIVLCHLVAYMIWIGPWLASDLRLPWGMGSFLSNTYAQTAKPLAHIVYFAAALAINQLLVVRAAAVRLLARRCASGCETLEAVGIPTERLFRLGFPLVLASPLAFFPPLTLPVLILTVVRLIHSQKQIVSESPAAQT